VNGDFAHEPVLLEEVLQLLRPREGGVYLDCTLGGGGHAEALLEKGGATARLIGMDRDKAALERCSERLKPFWGRVDLINDRFENLAGVLSGTRVDGILMDLGVSSFMFDDPSRGFSLVKDGPLDMRMDRSQSLTAEKIVNTYSERELSRIFRGYGEERYANRIARRIALERAKKPITRTLELAQIVMDAVPHSKRMRIHPATRVFMALRIEVNGELERLESAVRSAVEHLNPGGRLAVIAFHSLEDRIIKRTFASMAKGCVCPPHVPVCVCGKKPVVKLVTRKAIKPGSAEMSRNPRSRSARLRCAERIAE